MSQTERRTNPTKARRALLIVLTMAALGAAVAAGPIGFAGGVGLHRLLQPQRSVTHASVSGYPLR